MILIPFATFGLPIAATTVNLLRDFSCLPSSCIIGCLRNFGNLPAISEEGSCLHCLAWSAQIKHRKVTKSTEVLKEAIRIIQLFRLIRNEAISFHLLPPLPFASALLFRLLRSLMTLIIVYKEGKQSAKRVIPEERSEEIISILLSKPGLFALLIRWLWSALLAESVIFFPLFGVRQHRVSFTNLFESLLSCGHAIRVLVWVPSDCECPIGFLDHIQVGTLRDT